MPRVRASTAPRLARRIATLAVAAATLAACALPPEPPPEAAREPFDWPRLVRYAEHLAEVDIGGLGHERRLLEAAHGANPGGDAAVRLAVLMNEPRAEFRDPLRARRLLAERLAGDEALAATMLDLLGQLARRIEGERQARAELAHTRGDSHRLQAEIETLRAQLARERESRAELARQIDALKAIERSLETK